MAIVQASLANEQLVEWRQSNVKWLQFNVK
jgi:hypothetical protein